MNLKTILTFSFFLLINISFAQNKVDMLKTVESNSLIKESYPLHAREYLQKFYKEIGYDISKDIFPGNRVQKAAWNFQVGTTVTWKAINFQSNSYYSVPSTCRKVGTNCYIFVEDAIWDVSVNQDAVNSVAEAFDSKTPADPNRGIYEINVETFGDPPNVDGDLKIILFILDIKDNYAGPGSGYVAGYFSSTDEGTSSNSNRAEIFYMDGVQSNLTTAGGLETAMSTTAHEFQHMIHFNYIVNDETFYDECWSLTAEIVNGYGLYHPNLYAGEPNQYLYEWRGDLEEGLIDYSRAARFGLYLLEQFGSSLFKEYLNNRTRSTSGLNNTLAELGSARRLADILPDWFLANYLNNKTIDAKWGYNYSNLPQMDFREHTNPNVTQSDQVHNMGVQYINFSSGENLNIRFDYLGLPTNPNAIKDNFKIKAIKYGITIEVVDVPKDSDYSIPEFGTSVNPVTFLVYMDNTSTITGGGPFNYSYTSSGIYANAPISIIYDEADTEAALGAFLLTPGDSIAVFFDGVLGTKLDSLIVGLRNDKQITGKVYRTKTTAIRPGQTISLPFTLTGISSPEAPFPVPWPNMVKVDLTNQDIDAGSNFCVVFPYQGTSGNNIVVTERTPSAYYHSLTYLNEPTSGTPGWYYLAVSDNSVGIYVIRAYVSYGGTDVSEPIEILPTNYALDQNYPNPFNPETVISFSLPSPSIVNIKIYDVLGNEIRTLIDEERSSGKHNIYWNATDNFGRRVSSGVYFYTITADKFVETKKMVFMK